MGSRRQKQSSRDWSAPLRVDRTVQTSQPIPFTIGVDPTGATVVVPIAGDVGLEPDETFWHALGNP